MEPTDYALRRRELAQALRGAAALIPSAPLRTRSHDTEYPFRQSSQLKYLTGLEDEQEAVLLITPEHPAIQEVLFVRPKDPLKEMWSGRRLGPEKARELLEIEHVYTLDELPTKLPELLLGHSAVALDLFESEGWVKKILEVLEGLNQRKKLARQKPLEIHHLAPLIGRQRLVKDANEIQFIKKAAELTTRAHHAAMAMAAPGRSEAEIMALLHFHFRSHPAGDEAYESIVAGGENACILHYVANNQPLKAGELLLIDAGAEFHTYASDVTRTFPIDGKFQGAGLEVYEICLHAQKEAMTQSRPGKTLDDVHRAACQVLAQGLADLKVFQERPADIIEQGLLKKYYPHSTSHWLGLDVHDPCPYFDEQQQPINFAPGMVFTIEPGLYFPPDDTSLPERLRGIGVRIEDDLLITEKSYENLTSGIAKEVRAVEEACKRDYREFFV